jgi:hypothetical protein
MLRALVTWFQRARIPLALYVLTAGVYCAVLGPRLLETSPDNHYAHLAEGFLEGRLSLPGRPPGTNDWACYDTQLRGPCPPGFFFPGAEPGRYVWYVSFPPFPGVVMTPLVAVMGVDAPDRLFWALIAGLGPMLLFITLRRLREDGQSERTLRDDLLLTLLFAFGSVFFFVAVQGTVWFAAHVVATTLLCLYVHFGLGARRPVLAGLMLGLCFLTRPTTALLAIVMALEIVRVAQRERAATEAGESPPAGALASLRNVDWSRALRLGALFSAPILVCGAVAMWMNQARFDDPFEFGHSLLQISWRGRIEKWGLFNYHYVGRNLAVFTSSLPWLTAEPPHFIISRHGLALWVTTPALLLLLSPLRQSPVLRALTWAVIPVVIVNLMYQNSGWVQFGYRFALDYLPLLFVMLALGGRRFGKRFIVVGVFAVALNTFGAVTFDRAHQFYDGDRTQTVLFQPD